VLLSVWDVFFCILQDELTLFSDTGPSLTVTMNLSLCSETYYLGNTNNFILGKSLKIAFVKQLNLNVKQLSFESCDCVVPASLPVTLLCRQCSVQYTNSDTGLTGGCTYQGCTPVTAYPF
jgi:hypothetical protein